MSAHTPAPWGIRARAGARIIDSPSGYVARIARSGNAEANAFLIAAAPDLLVSARRLLDSIDEIALTDEDARQALIAAIAKAEGRT